MGPRALRILQTDWGCPTMAEKGGDIMPPLQGVLQCNTRRPPVPHVIQHVSQSNYLKLGDGGVSNRGGRRGPRCLSAGHCGLFLSVIRTSRVDPAREVAEVVKSPHGRSSDKFTEESEHFVPYLTHIWRHVRGRVWDTDKGVRTNIHGAADAAGAVSGVQSGASRGFAAGAPP